MVGWPTEESLLGAFVLLCLTSISSNVLLSSLSPVYGSIQTHHCAGLLRIESLTAAFVVTFALIDFDFPTTPALLQICATPLLLQRFLFPLSSEIDPIYGLLVSQLITSLPPHLLSCHCFTHASSRYYVSISNRYAWSNNPNSFAQKFIRHCLLAAFYSISQRLVAGIVAYCTSSILDRYGYMSNTTLNHSQLLHGLAIIYVLLSIISISRRQLSLAVALWIVSVFACGDFSAQSHLERVNIRLEPNGYTILDSKISQTGYISVLENFKDRFRVLRNDHSLLGGIWMPNPEHGIYTPESVYPVFNILEAVRLMEGDGTDSHRRKNALIIGLGVGTAPSALAAHGIETTAVEIDTAVIEFAKNYFELHKAVTNVNADASSFITQAKLGQKQYDYIIHDVFSGGAEPLELFTVDFLKGVRDLLKSTGFVAINYAGDLGEPSTLATIGTIMDVFSHCRVFRDSEPQESHGKDILNIIAFCGKGGGNWAFRNAVEADFLGSKSRRQYLPPRYEIDQTNLRKQLEDVSALKLNGSKRDLEVYRLNSALEHWKIMRKVLPSVIWENY